MNRIFKCDGQNFTKLLARALNTLEPKDTPPWAMELADALRKTDTVYVELWRKDDGTPKEITQGLS